ncbi:hypothetical protein ABT255_31040 [Streptomyces mirabilis]|uniref:hypothetical protein n=1 Tax=Streptomyces mirabilis TaxID=68239 RepID=UPI0033206C50
MSVSTSIAVGDPFQRYAVEVAGTLPGPGLSPSVAAAGDVLVTRREDGIVRHRVAAARGASHAATG